jgi:histidinol-phosphate aminotransferase
MTRTEHHFAPTDEQLALHGDRDATAGLVDLAVNVRAGSPPPWLRERLAAVDLSRYPDDGAARAAVARRHRRTPGEVLLTAGAAEAFVLIARAMRPQHAVVVHPQFTEPEIALRRAGHAVHRVVLEPPFQLDATDVPHSADLVVIGNPTNPTSVLHPAAVLAGLARPGRVLVVDEAFADAVPGEPESLAHRSDIPGLVVVRSLTKTWGLAGLRAGYLLAVRSVVDLLAAAQPQWPVSSLAVEACIACSDPDAIDGAARWATELVDDRDRLLALLATVDGVRVVPGATAPFVLLQVPTADAYRRLRERGYAVRSGATFPGLGPEWLRVAVRDRDTSANFVRTLKEIL